MSLQFRMRLPTGPVREYEETVIPRHVPVTIEDAGGPTITVTVDLIGRRLTAGTAVVVTNGLASELLGENPGGENLPDPFEDELASIESRLTDALQRLGTLLHRAFGLWLNDPSGANGSSPEPMEWADPSSADWQPVAQLDMEEMRLSSGGILVATEEGLIETLLAEGGIAHHAWDLLESAWAARTPRDAWILAGTAAEIGVKYVLRAADEGKGKLLEELPSPPASKLFKSVLQDTLGKASSYHRDLVRGQEVRNRLVHRPLADAPSWDQTDRFMETVANALRELEAMLANRRGAPDAFIRRLESPTYAIRFRRRGGPKLMEIALAFKASLDGETSEAEALEAIRKVRSARALNRLAGLFGNARFSGDAT